VRRRLAEILGRHAVGVLKTMSGLEALSLVIDEADHEGPRHPMGAKVGFHGLAREGRPFSGVLVCAFATAEAALEVATAIASRLGVADAVTGTVESVDDVLGEFLNIIIGLTCPDWLELGLETEFDPPERLRDLSGDALAPRSEAFHLTLGLSGDREISFHLVFSPGHKDEVLSSGPGNEA
jgi:hypothetical protein